MIKEDILCLVRPLHYWETQAISLSTAANFDHIDLLHHGLIFNHETLHQMWLSCGRVQISARLANRVSSWLLEREYAIVVPFEVTLERCETCRKRLANPSLPPDLAACWWQFSSKVEIKQAKFNQHARIELLEAYILQLVPRFAAASKTLK